MSTVKHSSGLLASSRSPIDLTYPEKSEVTMTTGRLREPIVEWVLVADTLLASNNNRNTCQYTTTFKLKNVTGFGKDQVTFIATVYEGTTLVSAAPGTIVRARSAVGPDYFIHRTPQYYSANYSGSGGGCILVELEVHENEATEATFSPDSLSSNFAELLERDVLSDVVLQVQDGDGKKDVHAHKAVLAARSPFFRRLFESDVNENKTNTVAVAFPHSVMEQVLRYVYTGRVDFGAKGQDPAEDQGDGDSVPPMDILAAADYYQLKGLKRLCQSRLLEIIGEKPKEEMLAIVVLADRYRVPQLKKAALDLAASNIKQILQLPDWDDFMRDHRILATELTSVLADKLQKFVSK